MNTFRKNLCRTSGFTLVELLVVIAIIAILSAGLYTGVAAAMLQAKKAQASGAAKNLISAYLAATDAESGQVMTAYDRTINSVTLMGGSTLSGPAAQRYPWRLSNYLNGNVTGSVLVGDVAHQIDVKDTYMVSCFPAFGINYIFVGGDVQADHSYTYPNECITSTGNSEPVLVFATAWGDGSGDPAAGGSATGKISGYCILTPPNLTGPMWNNAPYTKKSAPGDYGNVDPRYNGKAVCAFLDGSVSAKSIDELRDMQLWSRNAARTGNANYTVATTGGGGRAH